MDINRLQSLVDFSKPLDVEFLDEVIEQFYMLPSQDIQNALVMFQNNEQSWTRVDSILQQSKKLNTKLYALNILEDCVKTKWKILPQDQRNGIKKFIVNIIIQSSNDQNALRTNMNLLKKLNIVLVQIVKQDWPHNWPSFIPELVNSSRQSESLCANNMNILKLLSEEIFDFSSNEITSDKVNNLKQSLNNEFTLIFQLCEYVMDQSQDQTLLSASLSTLQRFLHWIPIGYIFETSLIDTLTLKFFPVPVFQNETLMCLAEIASIKTKNVEYNQKIILLFVNVINFVVTNLLTTEVDVERAYEQGGDRVQVFIRQLAIFICGYLKVHLQLLENTNDDTRKVLIAGLTCLLRISTVRSTVVFKICLEYWGVLVLNLYQTMKKQTTRVTPLMLGQNVTTAASARQKLFSDICTKLRLVLISKMAKPEEVVIVENEYGQIVREQMKDTDAIILYKTMRDVLIYLTHLDPVDTQTIMVMKLAKQVDGSEWSWQNLNRLCWAVGSISGALDEKQEKTFLVRVIKDLLGLCEFKRGKDNKAVVASNIMYVVGQYPRFLKMHWKFLKTVINKLFEFMHEVHPGVQEMSCETFLKICKKCRRKLAILHPNEMKPFVEEILDRLPEIISDLAQHEIHVFYEAVATIIQSESIPDTRQNLLMRLMTMPNQAWSTITQTANDNINILYQDETVKTLAWVLTINIKVAQALKNTGTYVVQLSRMYLEMLHIYKLYSEFVSKEIETKGEQYSQAAHVRRMRAVKRGVLRLVEEFVKGSQQNESGEFVQKFLPELMGPVLNDYRQCHPNAREAEVLSLFAEVIKKFGKSVIKPIDMVFASTFECTLMMIRTNFQDHPDHRRYFFQLIRAINAHAFPAILKLNAGQFKLVMDSIVWAFKHIERNISETGLNILLELLYNVSTSDVANTFYKAYFLSLLQDIFGVLTDRFHKFGFRLHAEILARLFSIVEGGGITVPLWDDSQPYPNNQTYVREFVVNLLLNAFPNVAKSNTVRFVQGLFQLNANLEAFKSHLRDFLIQLKEFSVDDNNELLFLEERERQMAEERARLAQVPGLIPQQQQQQYNNVNNNNNSFM